MSDVPEVLFVCVHNADPAGKDPAEVREIRDEIDRRVRVLLAELDASG